MNCKTVKNREGDKEKTKAEKTKTKRNNKTPTMRQD